MRRRLLPFIAMALAVAMPAGAATLDPKTVNEAELSAKAGSGPSPAIIKAQVLLDRAKFSPGVIDGHMGENVRQAVAAFRKANGLGEGDKLDKETWSKLTTISSEPILKEYTIAKEDVDGPFTKEIPEKMEMMAKLDRLAYRSPRELIAEKFHMDEDLLDALNPEKPFDEAGTTIVVANPGTDKPDAKAEKVVVDKG
jgi:hypothetical protein